MAKTRFQTIQSVERRLEDFQWLGLLLVRGALGYVFFLTGLGKLRHLGGVIQFFTSLGIPAPKIMAPFVALTELVCGGLLILGLGTRWASMPLLGTMVVALVTAKGEDITDLSALLALPEFLYITLLAVLIFSGAGKFSVDGWGRTKKR